MYSLLVFLPTLFLSYQGMACFGFIPCPDITIFSDKVLMISFLHGCICKWAPIFALLGLFISGAFVLTKKENRTDAYKNTMVRYGIFYCVLALLSIL